MTVLVSPTTLFGRLLMITVIVTIILLSTLHILFSLIIKIVLGLK